MRTTRPDRPVARLVAAAALLLTATGCSLPGVEAAAPDASAGATTARLAGRMERVLRHRARALRGTDRSAFLETVGSRSARFVAREETYFANLAQLPLAALSYRVDRDTITHAEGRYHAVVEVRLQLDGYDEVPVVRPARFTFAERPGGRGLVVVGDRDQAWEERNDVPIQPWDTGPVVVRRGAGVLGIFDERSVARAPQVVAAVDAGIDQVSAVVPYPWSGRVVVYALSDTRTLDGLAGLPVTDPDGLDAVAFPVPARAAGDRVASTRFLLHPRMLASDPEQLARLIRHELTHVAVAERDDTVPTWLAEGIAEWVSVQPMARTDRLLSRQAIRAAAGGPDDLPGDPGFNGPDQAAHYGLSWWACQTVVDVYGDQVLWTLLDRLAATSPDGQADELEQVLGMDTRELARTAARRILATYS